MVQAPPSLLWQSRHQHQLHHNIAALPSTSTSTSATSSSPSSSDSDTRLRHAPVQGTGSDTGNSSNSSSNDAAESHDRSSTAASVQCGRASDVVAIAALKAKQRVKARAPSFTSSPLSQRPLSPSAMSDSGSESSNATATARRSHGYPRHTLVPTSSSSPAASMAIDILQPSPVFSVPSSSASGLHRAHRARFETRSLTGLTHGELHASSSSSEDEQDLEVAKADQSMEATTTTYSRSAPRSSYHRASPTGTGSGSGHGHGPTRLSPVQAMSISPRPVGAADPGSSSSATSPQLLRSSMSGSPRSQRRRSSGNYGANRSPLLSSTTPPQLSPSPFSSSFAGSYEASLLSGRMANKPTNSSAPLPFCASLGVLGLGKDTPRGLKCPDHIAVDFGAYFWDDIDSSVELASSGGPSAGKGKGSPYVGTLDLEEHYMQKLEASIPALDGLATSGGAAPRFPGYRIPPKGQIQLVIKNANQTAVKLFLVPYDLSDMPPGTKTFLRQKSYDVVPAAAAAPDAGSSSSSAGNGAASPSSSASRGPKETLRYAVHLQFCAPPMKETDRGRRKSVRRGHRLLDKRGGSHARDGTVSDRWPSPYERQPAASQSPSQTSRPAARSDTSTASYIYLHKNVRVVFTSRALDLSEKLKVVLEDPAGSRLQQSSIMSSSASSGKAKAEALIPIRPHERYSSYGGPGEEWEALRRRKHLAEKALERRLRVEDPVPRNPDDPGSSYYGTTVEDGVGTRESLDRVAPLLNTLPSAEADSIQRSFASFAQNQKDASAPVLPPVLEQAVGSRSSWLPSRNGAETDAPQPLTFQRSPTPVNVPLPALMESGLSISRPGSRGEARRLDREEHSGLERRQPQTYEGWPAR